MSDNIFDKLDDQKEKIDDISLKLEGISVNDLYALADRTYEAGDYVTAQKYYNHISFLKPLEWRAPLMASLCNYHGYHNVYDALNFPSQLEKVYISNIKYINALDLDEDRKETEMAKCLGQIGEDLICNKDFYFRNQETLDNADKGFLLTLENLYLNMYNATKIFKYESMPSFHSIVCDSCLELIEKTQRLSPNISKEDLEMFKKLSKNNHVIDSDKLSRVSLQKLEDEKELSQEEKQEIALNGELFFEFKDKYKANRIFKRDVIFGSILVFTSFGAIIIAFLFQWYWMFVFSISLCNGIFAIIKGYKLKGRVNCASFFSINRFKTRLNSDGKIVREKTISYMQLFALLNIVSILGWLAFAFVGFKENNNYEYATIVYAVLAVIDWLTTFVYFRIMFADHLSTFDGRFIYKYKDKYYQLEK